ncbi:hypothetical protein PPYR_04751 [Photinus pyralis]|uniref:YqaJ viral recombinase domain-containing protein n=1 Tax=Photinus pyralis TaxID=7054 RepID=A0A5N4AYZ2_PHOPY|nr:hypothetical protein PPYR_04751 [Photinus pyralis]
MADPGFVKAQSDNLPHVDALMVAEFFASSDKYTAAEIRGLKAMRAGRESYGDAAVGYVQIQRSQNVCTIKCRLCPEHRVRQKNYSVVVVIDEVEEKILSADCQDCAAGAGGCKHAVAFVMWLHRRSEEPSPTDVESYWRKSKLAGVGTSLKYITVKNFGAAEDTPAGSSVGAPLLARLIEGKRMTPEICNKCFIATKEQSSSVLWHELRYARITASKVYEAARCKTLSGSLVESIFGAKLKETAAINRGKLLEDEVLSVLQKQLNMKFSKVGLMLSGKYPVLGASPDAVNEEFVVEVKCPSSEKAVNAYVTKDNKIVNKYRAQIQLQMLVNNKKSGIFCVADTNFESNKVITVVRDEYDHDFIQPIIEMAVDFWKAAIFPKVLNSLPPL